MAPTKDAEGNAMPIQGPSLVDLLDRIASKFRPRRSSRSRVWRDGNLSRRQRASTWRPPFRVHSSCAKHLGPGRSSSKPKRSSIVAMILVGRFRF